MSSRAMKIGSGGKSVRFTHTAVNKDTHMFIDGTHDPKLCPECIQPGSLTELANTNSTKEGKE